MDESRPRKWLSYGSVASVMTLLLLGSVGYAFMRVRRNKQLSANFNVKFPNPTKGWVSRPHSPEFLFMYEDAKRGLTLRGAVNQMVSDINPTPDLDRDHVAQLIVDNTLSNMPGWTAEVKDIVQSQGTSFRLVRRTQQALVIVTAFAVEGNTTLLVSLSARDKQKGEVDKDMPEFHDFISQIKLIKADSLPL